MKKKICLPMSDLDIQRVDNFATKLQITRAEAISRIICFYFEEGNHENSAILGNAKQADF